MTYREPELFAFQSYGILTIYARDDVEASRKLFDLIAAIESDPALATMFDDECYLLVPSCSLNGHWDTEEQESWTPVCETQLGVDT